MYLEIAGIEVIAGRESAFEPAVAEAAALFLCATGCREMLGGYRFFFFGGYQES